MDGAEAAGDRRAARSAGSSSTRSRSTASRSTSLEDAPDWNISRQLWWGHQIPLWTCAERPRHLRRDRRPTPAPSAARPSSTRETDVLDTWFSSALWPFATLGWPDETADLAAFYPGNLQTTARDIIRLWENRMIFSRARAAGRDAVHRRDHPLDRARRRRAAGCRSRSAPAIDPLEVIEQHGTDATRYGLLKMSSAQDVRFSTARSRRAASSRTSSGTRAGCCCRHAAAPCRPSSRVARGALDPRADRRDRAPRSRTLSPRFDFSHAVQALYHLIFDDFCDWYLEAIKPRLYGGDEATRGDGARARSSGC